MAIWGASMAKVGPYGACSQRGKFPAPLVSAGYVGNECAAAFRVLEAPINRRASGQVNDPLPGLPAAGWTGAGPARWKPASGQQGSALSAHSPAPLISLLILRADGMYGGDVGLFNRVGVQNARP
jgi:hypothetical protein